MWERTLASYEERHSFRLPEEYRDFLLTMGDGPAGPAYGLLPLAEAIDAATKPLADALGEPFPLVDRLDEERSELHGEAVRAERDPEVDSDEVERLWARLTVGTLPLCNEGCNYVHLLVVNGPKAGSMWIDGRSSDAGIWPLEVGFADWYERWLTEVERGNRGTWWI